VVPVPRGGIPADIPRLTLKLSFNDGGHNEFREKFEYIKEQLHHAMELQREFGCSVVTDEPLPPYCPPAGGDAPQANTVSPESFTDYDDDDYDDHEEEQYIPIDERIQNENAGPSGPPPPYSETEKVM